MTPRTIIPMTPRLPAPRAKKLWPMPPATSEERLERIEALGQRIAGYVQFMCAAGTPHGASPDAKKKAVDAFYEKTVVLDPQLAHTHETSQLKKPEPAATRHEHANDSLRQGN